MAFCCALYRIARKSTNSLIAYPIQVLWKCFYSMKSAGEHGTLYQLRNLLNRSNVVKDPTKDFNACEDFLLLVASSLVTVAAMTLLGMKSLTDRPSKATVLGPRPENLPHAEKGSS